VAVADTISRGRGVTIGLLGRRPVVYRPIENSVFQNPHTNQCLTENCKK
jgi:hypothetical protein